MEVQESPRLDNSLHCLQSPVLGAASGVCFICDAHSAVVPFSHSSAFLVPFLAIASAFCYSVIPPPFLFIFYFFSIPFAFLTFTLTNRKISSCKVRLRLVWDRGGCCCSRCAGIAARGLVGRVSTLNSCGAQTPALT